MTAPAPPQRAQAAAPSAWQIERILSAVRQALDALQPPAPINGETDTDEAHAEGMMDWLVNHGGAETHGGIDLPLVMERLLLASVEAESNADMVDRRIDALKVRKARFERQQKAWREAAFGIMATLPELFPSGKFKCALVSASVRTGQPGVIVTNEAALPDEYVRVKREPDKALIRADLLQGVVIEGAELRNPQPYLTVRTT